MAQNRAEQIRELLAQEQDFQLWENTEGDDLEHREKSYEYRNLILKLKGMLRSVLPEPTLAMLNEIDTNIYTVTAIKKARAQLQGMGPDIEEALNNFRVSTANKETDDAQKPLFWVTFSDIAGEVTVNDVFVVATPQTNGQNYRIISYLTKNPNRFVSVEELKEKALDGKDIDKRIADFVAQIHMNKELGNLFFDTSNDSIRLNTPITQERMTEKNIRKIRIKPA